MRNRNLGGDKFRRQFAIDPYIVDFICVEKRLIVEADGGQHIEFSDRDELRTKYLESKGFRVIRFWNHEILQETDVVLEQILRCLNESD